MKNRIASWTTLLLFLGLIFVFAQCQEEEVIPDDANQEENNGNGHGGHQGEACSNDLSAYPLEDLSTEEISTLLFMREEEKLARDVYLEFYDQYGLTPFTHISASEQEHMDMMLLLVDRYELEDPIQEDTPGVFANTDLQQLFDDLIIQGSTSEIEGLKVGAAIEEIDILDLIEAIEEANNQDLDAVYQCLLNGSYNHLKAFVKNLKNRDVIYEPQYLSPSQYDAIVNP
jgi:hypothetical protein